jgi:phosphoribosyl 1,2-cyclic phosphodiesterase
MALFIASLNSGSNGNCYYVGNKQEAVLIDAGISCREIEKRMLRLGLSIKKVKAVFISHEHSDHINGLPVLAKKHQLPVYITHPTRPSVKLEEANYTLRHFSAFEPITIGEMQIIGFPKMHDAVDPYSFVISYNGLKIGVFTDIGVVCNHVRAYFAQCQAVFLEANYDEEMLEKGSYPWHLKNRIRGGSGHISNKQALELFVNHRNKHLSHLILSHLSKNNNKPELVEKLFKDHAHQTNIIVASRYQESMVYKIEGELHNNKLTSPYSIANSYQTNLFS